MKRGAFVFVVFHVLITFAVLAMAGCGTFPFRSQATTQSTQPEPSTTRSTQPDVPPKWAGIVLTGEDEPLLEGTTWLYLANSTDLATLTYEFRDGGKLVLRYSGTYSGITYTSTHTWQRIGDTIIIINETGHWRSEGKYYPQTQRIMLTTETSDGNISEETWVPF